MKEIWIATTNQHKVSEYEHMFSHYGITVKSINDLQEKIDIVEDGLTFEENALIKAKVLSKLINKAVISDDSGLVIDCLNGEPGIHSARYLGHDTDYTYKNSVIIERLKQVSNRNCRFVCAIALVIPNKVEKVFVGTIEGIVNDKIEAGNGFGYDPIFYVPSIGKCLSQISNEEKNKISHRGKACEELMEYINHEM